MTRVQWFLCSNSPWCGDVSLQWKTQIYLIIIRHPLNNRQQKSVMSTYTSHRWNNLTAFAVCVRGEAWLLQPQPCDAGGQQAPYLALSYGSLSEAYYQALLDEPENQHLLVSLKSGLEVRLLHHRTPPDVVRFLILIQNGFHAGSGTSFCELVSLVPQTITTIWLAWLHRFPRPSEPAFRHLYSFMSSQLHYISPFLPGDGSLTSPYHYLLTYHV